MSKNPISLNDLAALVDTPYFWAFLGGGAAAVLIALLTAFGVVQPW